VVATPANVADSTVLPELLHGQETRVWGDQAYRGQRAVIRGHAPKARDFTNRRPLDGCKSKQIRATLCLHRVSPWPLALRQTIGATRFSQIRDPDAPTPFEKSGLERLN
jgi:hypothetical protein